MNSTRLPGKVAMPLAGRPMIEHVLGRAGRIQGVDEVVLAGADSPADDRLAGYVRRLPGVAVVQGAEDDVLGRFVRACRLARADVVVRITGDCPLLSPSVSGRVLRAYYEDPDRYDYASNTLHRTYPRGLDTEVVSRRVLERADAEAETAAEREHVTLHVCRRPDAFRLRSVEARHLYPRYRWTVDTRADYRLIRRIFDELYPDDPYFEFADVLELMTRRREWTRLNHHVLQKRPT